MEKPEPPPDAVLLRTVREAAGISTTEAARRAGISPVRLTQVENGYETRSGQVRPVRARAGTYAHVARAVGISADRLEDEGVRPDAVGILREIERQEEDGRARVDEQEDPQGPSADAAMSAAAVSAVDMLLHPATEEVWAEIRRARMRNPDATGHDIFADELEAQAWDLSDDPATEPDRATFVAFIRMKARQARETPGRPSNAR